MGRETLIEPGFTPEFCLEFELFNILLYSFCTTFVCVDFYFES